MINFSLPYRVFVISLTVQLLHFGALKSYGTFWSLYLPLRAHATADKVSAVALSDESTMVVLS